MLEKNPIQNDMRKASRTRTVGEASVCILCGLADPSVLHQVESKFLEDHHVVGRNHDPNLKLPICPNCHKKVTIAVADAGAEMEAQPHVLDRVIQIFRALGAFFAMLATALHGIAQEAEEALIRLTKSHPDWRNV